jgi:pimeloyl-ACP methyl ester carboxylesterase
MILGNRKTAQLSVRAHPRLGNLATGVKFDGTWPDGDPIIFIHGFNNNEKEAGKSYDKIKHELKKIGVSDFEVKRICPFYWPGNVGRMGLSIMSSASYPIQIGKAVRSAEMLSEFLLRRFPNSKRLVIIGHSLGCRLTLELLKQVFLRTAGTSKLITQTILMAAAVPVNMLVNNTSPLYSAKQATGHIANIYSPNDLVLKFAFPPGQFVVDKKFVKAVGLHGEPYQYWNSGYKNVYIGHNDYWKDEDVARYIAFILRIPASARLTPRKLPQAARQFW